MRHRTYLSLVHYESLHFPSQPPRLFATNRCYALHWSITVSLVTYTYTQLRYPGDWGTLPTPSCNVIPDFELESTTGYVTGTELSGYAMTASGTECTKIEPPWPNKGGTLL